MARRVSRDDAGGWRELLIDFREHRLPKSPPPPPWAAVRGQPDELLFDLKAGKSVVVSSAVLLSALVQAGLSPRRDYCFGGKHYRTMLRLDEQNRLAEWSG